MTLLGSRFFRQINCFKCDRMLNHPFVVCSKCNELQKIPSMDYFQLFSISNPSTLPNNLKQKYIQLQGMSHPDRHNSAESAQNMSSFISNAYNTVNDSFKRAEYALGLKNFKINDFDKVPQCFLMQVMELQEDENSKTVNKLIRDYHEQFWNFYEKSDFEQAKQALLKWKFLNKI
eukprot:NODE_363_length_10100_cov_0.133787.p5 type:complete len:175 gc:universal NODE_363_length_10100_cov_0.133787:2645-2121(-)